jgi:hypothetical protein
LGFFLLFLFALLFFLALFERLWSATGHITLPKFRFSAGAPAKGSKIYTSNGGESGTARSFNPCRSFPHPLQLPLPIVRQAPWIV